MVVKERKMVDEHELHVIVTGSISRILGKVDFVGIGLPIDNTDSDLRYLSSTTY